MRLNYVNLNEDGSLTTVVFREDTPKVAPTCSEKIVKDVYPNAAERRTYIHRSDMFVVWIISGPQGFPLSLSFPISEIEKAWDAAAEYVRNMITV